MKKNVKNWCLWLRISAAILPLSLASVAASAGIISVGFTTDGTGTWGGSCGTSCTDLTLTGNTVTTGLGGYFGASGAPDFTFSALLNVYGGLAPSGNWQLWDSSGDSLYGSVLAGMLFGAPGSTDLLLGFGVAGGTGVFGGTSGIAGWSLGELSGNGTLTNSAQLWLDSSSSPTSVPEPGALILFAAGLAALGWTARRRRRVTAG